MDVMISIRRLFWPSNRISDDVPQIQKDIDEEHGVRPAILYKQDSYHRLSEVPNLNNQWEEW